MTSKVVGEEGAVHTSPLSILNSEADEMHILISHLSRCKQAPWWERDDPVYEPWLFDNSINWQWHWKLEEGDYVRDIHGQPSRQAKKVPDFELTEATLKRIVKSQPLKRIIGALHGWHQLNAKQLCAFTGIDQRNLTRYTQPLFKAGILERGEYNVPTRNEQRNYLWRLNYGEGYKEVIKAVNLRDYYNLTYDIQATGSRPHERHNITVAEIVLRWLEVNNVFETQGIGPERVNQPRLMIPGNEEVFNADASIVRHDGLRIMLEVTQASNTGFLIRKMHRWMKLLASAPYSESGIHVIFINCSPYTPDDMSRSFRKIHATELIPEKTGLDPQQNFRAASRITFASYRDWFPDRWMVSDRFVNLTSIRRKGEGKEPEDWEEIDLFGDDQIKFKPNNPKIDWFAPAQTLPELYSTPPWVDEERVWIP